MDKKSRLNTIRSLDLSDLSDKEAEFIDQLALKIKEGTFNIERYNKFKNTSTIEDVISRFDAGLQRLSDGSMYSMLIKGHDIQGFCVELPKELRKALGDIDIGLPKITI